MHFAILDIEEKKDEHGTFMSYGIYINGGHHSSLRYSQLRELHDQLKKDFGADQVPDGFPPKKLLSLNQAQIEERREQLEKFLQSVSQDPGLVSSRTFIKFLLKAQKDSANVEEDDVKLDLYLMNGKKFQVDVRSTDSTDHVMQEAMAQIKLPKDMIQYFAMFLITKEEDGEISVVRRLQGFESPYLVLLKLEETHRLVIRKNFWKPSTEEELSKDKIALNLLFVQAVSDVERDWTITTPETLKELNSLKTKNERKKYLQLARTQKFYGYLQFKPCVMDFPESNSHVIINIGGFELNFRLIGTQKTKGREGSFKVTRIKCWRVVSSRDGTDGEVITKVAFEYLFSKEKLQWITITSDQAMLMSLCLQSMVNEIIQDKSKTKQSSTCEGSKSTSATTTSSAEAKPPTKEKLTKSSVSEKEEKPTSSEKQDSNLNEGSHHQKNGNKKLEESPSVKKSSRKGKKHRKNIATVENEVFAKNIGDADL